MFTIKEYEKIKTKEIKEFLIELNKILDGRVLNNKTNDKLIPSELDIKYIKARFKLAEFINKKFFNDELIKSLNMNNDLSYYKQFNISKNLLFKSNSEYRTCFERIIWTKDGIYDPYLQYIDFIEELKYNINNDIKNGLINFINDDKNKYILYSYPEPYLSLNEEINNLYQCEYGEKPNQYKEFKKGFYYVDENEILEQYKNKKKGNIGEILSFETLNKFRINTYFISKLLGDGYGYDIHTHNYTKEGLIESKTTHNDINDNNDYFTLSNNEYNVMLDTLEKENVNYYIYRVFIKLNKDYKINDFINYHTILPLYPINEKLLKSDNGIEYEYNHDYNGNKVFYKKIK